MEALVFVLLWLGIIIAHAVIMWCLIIYLFTRPWLPVGYSLILLAFYFAVVVFTFVVYTPDLVNYVVELTT